MNLIHTDPHARPHVAVTIQRHLDRQLVIGGEGTIASDIPVDPPTPLPTTPITAWSQAVRSLRTPVVSQTIVRGVGEENALEFREIAFNLIQFCHYLGQLLRREVNINAAHTIDASKKPRFPVRRSLTCISRSFILPQWAGPTHRPCRYRWRQRRLVICEPLQLQKRLRRQRARRGTSIPSSFARLRGQ